jgi:hypothetical protein
VSGTISTRWFFADWMSDPALRACGYAARGLWKDMLCIAGANKGRDHGHLVLNGNRLAATEIAKMTGGTLDEVKSLLEELDRNGVFSVTRTGIIYCRRMVRSEKSRANGKLGGRPKALKSKPNPNPVSEKPNPPILQDSTMPKPKEPPQPPDGGEPVRVEGWPRDYRDQFWNRYPKKVEKKIALEKLDAVRTSGTVVWGPFIAAVDRYAAEMAARGERRYVKNPTTWLNRGCWDDEPDEGGLLNGIDRQEGDGRRGAISYGGLAAGLRSRNS